METAKSRKMKVLLVDSDYDFLKILTPFLEKEGFQVIRASDGEEGLNKALVESPDLVILEPLLSKMHGFTLCNMITTEFKRKIPVIIITNHLEEEHFRTEAIETHGASAYLTRPIMKDELRKVIRDVLGDGDKEATMDSPDEPGNQGITSDPSAEEIGDEGSAQIQGDEEEMGKTASAEKTFFDWEVLVSGKNSTPISQETNEGKTDTGGKEATVKTKNTSGFMGFSLNSIRERLRSAVKNEEISSENYQERSISAKSPAATGSDDRGQDEKGEPEKEPCEVQPDGNGNNGAVPAQIDTFDEMLTEIIKEFGLMPSKAASGGKQVR